MDRPRSSPVLEVSRPNSVTDKRLPKVSSSLSQSLVDLTKQLLNWPQFGVPVNSAEEKTEQKIELPEYSLVKAQWTPTWPENFAEEEIEQNIVLPDYSLAKAQSTPNWPDNFSESTISEDSDRNDQSHEEDIHKNVEIDADMSDQEDTCQNVQSGVDLSEEKDTHQNVQSYADFSDGEDKPQNVQSDEADAYQNVQNDLDLSDLEYTRQNVHSDTDTNDQGNLHQNIQSDVDLRSHEDSHQNVQSDSDVSDQEDTHQNDQNDLDLTDKDLDESNLETRSKVSFETTEYWETAAEIDKETRSESSAVKQPELSSQNEVDDDMPTCMPSWTEHNDEKEDFDNLLDEIASYIDSSTNADEDLTEEKKWFVDLGNNRNYIKALVNYDLNNNRSKDIKSRKDFEKAKLNRKFKWNISYDNLNYIRSLLSPDIFERILSGDLFKQKEPQKQRISLQNYL